MTSEHEQGKNTKAENNGHTGSNANLVWIGVGVGAAIGVAVAISRRKRDRWYAAKEISRRVAGHTGDLAVASKDIFDRLKIIYGESCKVIEEASDLWSRGRKLAGV
ncbi:MAG TPA: hypothetical protein VN924_12175 [Bryobacteraceae bacterium]|nr:hypothetical protein [Bryobacteraceae bacterium]